jgi:hypothetical protein
VEKHEEAHKLATEVASFLTGFRFDKKRSTSAQGEAFPCAYITDGFVTLMLDTRYGSAKPGKVAIRACVETRTAKGEYISTAYGVKTPEITCSTNRGAEAIAADITRRLLKEAQEVTRSQNARIAEYNAFESAKDAAAKRLARFGGRGHVNTPEGSNVYGTFRIDGGDSVKIEVCGLSVDLAEKVLALITGAEK